MTASTDVESWDLALPNVAAEYERLRRTGDWVYGPQDFFGILRMGRAELAHSTVLAWLMNPDARHRFGRRFLDVLVSRCWSDLDLDSFRVRSVDCEVQRAETRADIVVWGDTASLVFEVKVDAGEEFRQCDRLYERFSSEPGARFIYLTPTGRKPLTATGDAADAFSVLSMRQVADALAEVLQDVDTGDAMVTTHDYLRTLRREFG